VIAIPPLNKMQAIVTYKHALYFLFLFFLDISLSNDSIYVDRSGASSFHLFFDKWI
jgi:hypothetical protein